MGSPKEEYLEKRYRGTRGTADDYFDVSRPPGFFDEARERVVHAQIMHDLFKGKIDMPVGQWAQYLDRLAEQHPNHSYAISGHHVSEEQRSQQRLLVLLAGQASGKSALRETLTENGAIDTNKSVVIDTSFFLNRMPEMASLASEDKEAAMPRVAGELFYLQQLAAKIALANGISPVLDVHIIDEEKAKEFAAAARENHVPSILISPHVSMGVYADRSYKRSLNSERGAFKPEHITFHQVLADNFEHHFKHIFDAGIIVDNNVPMTSADAGLRPFAPIYAFENRDGKLHEAVFNAEEYAAFRAKANMVPHVVNSHIDTLKDMMEHPDRNDLIRTYLNVLSRQLRQQAAAYRTHATPLADVPSADTTAGQALLATGLLHSRQST